MKKDNLRRRNRIPFKVYGQLKSALEGILSAASANSEPIHYKVREAIQSARETLADTEEEMAGDR